MTGSDSGWWVEVGGNSTQDVVGVMRGVGVASSCSSNSNSSNSSSSAFSLSPPSISLE